jgi:hypothetical protein
MRTPLNTPFLERPCVLLLRQRLELLLYIKKRHYKNVFVFYWMHTVLSVRQTLDVCV